MNTSRPSSFSPSQAAPVAPAVLVSLRVDPVSGRATRSAADAAVAALARQACGAAPGAPVPRLVHAGALPEAVARDYLALGLPLLQQWVGAGDALDLLVRACAASPLVLAGARAESGLGSGLLPYALAEALHRPLLADVIDLQRESDGHWRVTQALPRGARHHWRLAADAPAVLVASARLPQRAGLVPRHAWADARAGRIETLSAELDGAARPTPAAQPDWVPQPARRQRVALAAASRASGAERMARATGSAGPRGGGTLLREGSVEDKARALLERLQALALVQPR